MSNTTSHTQGYVDFKSFIAQSIALLIALVAVGTEYGGINCLILGCSLVFLKEYRY